MSHIVKILSLIISTSLLVGVAYASTSPVSWQGNYSAGTIQTPSGYNQVLAPYFTATSTTATSTFAGIVNIGGSTATATLSVLGNSPLSTDAGFGFSFLGGTPTLIGGGGGGAYIESGNGGHYVGSSAGGKGGSNYILAGNGGLGGGNGGNGGDLFLSSGNGGIGGNDGFSGGVNGSGGNIYMTLGTGLSNGQVVIGTTTATSSNVSLYTNGTTTSPCFSNNGTTCIGGGTPGGSDSDIQYNADGVFGGDNGFVYTGGNVGIGTTLPTSALTVMGDGFFSGNLTGTNITANGTASFNSGGVIVQPGYFGTQFLINGGSGYEGYNAVVDIDGGIALAADGEVDVGNGGFTDPSPGSAYDIKAGGPNGGITSIGTFNSDAGYNLNNNTIIDSSGNATFASVKDTSVTSAPCVATDGSGTFIPTSCVATTSGDWAGTWQTHSPSYFQIAGSYLTNLLGGLNAILGNSTTTNATTTSLAITGITNAILGTNANGSVISTTSPTFASVTTTGTATVGNVVSTGSATSTFAGSVGIGTTNPTTPLMVNGTASVSNIVSSSTATSTFAGSIQVTAGTIVNNELTIATSSTMTINWSQATQQLVKLGHAAVTINFSGVVAGGVLRLPVCQDGTGGATVTWDSRILWASSTAPTLVRC